MNVLALCAGVGGLDLGIRIAVPGARGIAYVEREAYAAANLVARMEDGWLDHAPVWPDLGNFDARPWRGKVHCVTSGDPCQPNSVAGRGLGDADERWLIDQVLRVFDESGADRLFRENVPGNIDGQLAALVPPLERMGCRVAAGIFSAAEAGGSHRRERLFIMADRSDGRRGERRDAPQQGRGRYANGGNTTMGNAARQRWDESHPCSGAPGPLAPGGPGCELADAGDTGPQGLAAAGCAGPGNGNTGRGCGTEIPLCAPGPADPAWPAIVDADPLLAPAVGNVELWNLARRNCGLPPLVDAVGRRGGLARDLDPETARLVKSEVRRMAHVLAPRVDRLRACGNGVFPLAAALAWRSLDACLREG